MESAVSNGTEECDDYMSMVIHEPEKKESLTEQQKRKAREVLKHVGISSSLY